MGRWSGAARALSRPMANRARSLLTAPTRRERSSAARPFTTRARIEVGGPAFAKSYGVASRRSPRRIGPLEDQRSVIGDNPRDCRSSLFSAGNLLHERLEARLTAQILEQWIDLE